MTKRYARYALGVIAFANFLSYLDRQLVSAIEKQLTQELAFTSDEFGWLWSLFTLGYMACSPFIGFMSDRYRRTRIFAVCIFVWSLATIASGMAQEKWVLYVARFFIGLGEAGCLIIGSALIADFFSKESRGRALSIFYLGLPLGGTFAFIMAGLLRELVGWRALFYIAGAPGFLITILIWILIDPPRGSSDDVGHGHAPPRASLREYGRLFRIPSLMYIILAQAFAMVILAPLIHFGVMFFEEARGMEQETASIALGVIALVAGVIGNSLSGVLGDRLSKKSRGAYATLAGIAYLCGLPFFLGGFVFESPWLFLPAVTMGAMALFLCMPAVNTQIANVTPPAQRAMAWALAVFVLHLLGDLFSNPLFGLVEQGIGRQTAFCVFAFALIPASICCFLSARSTARDEERALKGPDAPPAPES